MYIFPYKTNYLLIERTSGKACVDQKMLHDVRTCVILHCMFRIIQMQEKL